MKAREWYIERSNWTAYEPGTSGLDDDAIHVREVLPDTVTITRELARAMAIICARFQNEGCIIDVQNVASELERVLNPDDKPRGES